MCSLSLTEIFSDVRALSRFDKLRLIQFLAVELENDEPQLIEPGQTYPIWSPHDSFCAASTMLDVLDSKRGELM